jgi:shikimate kinase
LIGFIAAGKSRIGRLLAEALGCDFVDTDILLEQAVGCSAADFFVAQGEAAFREQEAEAVRQATERQGVVMACGGGVVINPENVRRLRASGVLVYLVVSPEEAAARLLEEARVRPILGMKLAELDPEEYRGRAEALLAARRDQYEQAADLQIETTGRSPEEVCAAILEALSGWHLAEASRPGLPSPILTSGKNDVFQSSHCQPG